MQQSLDGPHLVLGGFLFGVAAAATGSGTATGTSAETASTTPTSASAVPSASSSTRCATAAIATATAVVPHRTDLSIYLADPEDPELARRGAKALASPKYTEWNADVHNERAVRSDEARRTTNNVNELSFACAFPANTRIAELIVRPSTDRQLKGQTRSRRI